MRHVVGGEVIVRAEVERAAEAREVVHHDRCGDHQKRRERGAEGA